MKSLHTSLLAAALHLHEAEASAAWKHWRNQVDVQHLSWPEIQFLPLLNGPRLNAWLAEDEAAGLMKGIIRRAWTEAQVRIALAQTIATQLEQAQCGPVIIIGAAGFNLRNRVAVASDWIRPVAHAELLIHRDALAHSVQALLADGWKLYGDGELPSGEALDWCTHLPLYRESARLHLYWRAIDVPADCAAACEEEFLNGFESITLQGSSFRILDATHALLAAISSKSVRLEDDPIPWQIDTALLLSQQIDWARWSQLAAAYCLPAFDRLAELRQLGLPVPALSAPRPPRTTMRQHLAALRHPLRNAIRRTSHRLLQRIKREARRLLPVEVKRS